MENVRVLGYVLEGKPDNSSKAWFTNSNRAEQYALMLLKTGDYKNVSLNNGITTYWIEKEAVADKD